MGRSRGGPGGGGPHDWPDLNWPKSTEQLKHQVLAKVDQMVPKVELVKVELAKVDQMVAKVELVKVEVAWGEGQGGPALGEGRPEGGAPKGGEPKL